MFVCRVPGNTLLQLREGWERIKSGRGLKKNKDNLPFVGHSSPSASSSSAPGLTTPKKTKINNIYLQLKKKTANRKDKDKDKEKDRLKGQEAGKDSHHFEADGGVGFVESKAAQLLLKGEAPEEDERAPTAAKTSFRSSSVKAGATDDHPPPVRDPSTPSLLHFSLSLSLSLSLFCSILNNVFCFYHLSIPLPLTVFSSFFCSSSSPSPFHLSFIPLTYSIFSHRYWSKLKNSC